MSIWHATRLTMSDDIDKEEDDEESSPTEGSEEKEAENTSKQIESQSQKTKKARPSFKLLPPTTTIFVNNIPRNADQDRLMETFSAFGEVKFVSFVDLYNTSFNYIPPSCFLFFFPISIPLPSFSLFLFCLSDISASLWMTRVHLDLAILDLRMQNQHPRL